jgi:hypothetical protein
LALLGGDGSSNGWAGTPGSTTRVSSVLDFTVGFVVFSGEELKKKAPTVSWSGT